MANPPRPDNAHRVASGHTAGIDADDYAAAVCVCGRLILAHRGADYYWHADGAAADGHRPTRVIPPGETHAE